MERDTSHLLNTS